MEREKLELLNELDRLQKEDISDKEKTRREKEKFILKIRNGLGEEIKKNPNKIVKLKKPLGEKIKEKIRNFFISIFKIF